MPVPVMGKNEETRLMFSRPRDLTRMHQMAIVMHMRTTMILDDELIAKARGITGLQEKTALVHEGLRALIARESARKLAALGGSEPGLRVARRRRPVRRRRSG